MVDDASFDLISILYSFLSVDTIWRLTRHWRSFWDETVTPMDQFLAQRVALFILIPVGVLLHELGHALATWQLGGEVRDFQWRIFWGYIIRAGEFTPVGDWWIAFSGNLVSITLGLAAIPAVLLVRRPILKEVFYYFAIAELVYSLVVYPIFSFMALRGDWLKIYNFSVAPYAQIVLGIHLVLLAVLWLATKKYDARHILLPESGKHPSIPENSGKKQDIDRDHEHPPSVD